MSTEPDTSATVFDGDVQAVARTYAEAVLNVATRAGEADAVVGELEELDADLLRSHQKFAGLFSSPSIPPHEKDRILTRAFEGRAMPTVLRFLRVLNNHGRLGLVGPIAAEARSLWTRGRTASRSR